MTCRELAELLMHFLEGELDEEQAAHLKEHMDMCPPCFHYFESYQITVRITAKIQPSPLPNSLWQKLQACLEEEPEQDKEDRS